MKNYFKVTSGSILSNLFFDYYFYVDTKDYRADRIFITNKIWFKIKKEFHNSESEYCIILIKVKRKEREKFIECMDQLGKNQLIGNNRTYMEDADLILTSLVKNFMYGGRM